jgi:hypothetical protein
MRLLAAGVPVAQARTFLRQLGLEQPHAECLESSEFFTRAQQGEASVEGPDSLWLWLYQAPWSLTGEVSIDHLNRWTDDQRRVLRLRQKLGKRLLLVNADQPPAARHWVERGIVAAAPKKALPEGAPSVSTLAMAHLFALMAPSYWDVFETLEAAAWLGDREPVFRSSLPRLPDEALATVEKQLQLGEEYPTWRSRHEQTMVSLDQLSASYDEATAEVTERMQAIERLQAAKSQAEKQAATLAAEATQRADALKATQAAAKKQAEELRGQLERSDEALKTATAAHQKQFAESEKARAALATENEQLLLQLHQVQEELERYYLANRSMVGAMEESKTNLHRARVVISRFLSADAQ